MAVTLQWLERERGLWHLQIAPSPVDAAASLDSASLRAFLDALQEAEEAAIRALVITGTSERFCEGMALSSFLEEEADLGEDPKVEEKADQKKNQKKNQESSEEREKAHLRLQEGVHLYARLLLGLRKAPYAVIAGVEGSVMAGGVGLMAAADIVIATEEARFGLPEAMLGLLPAMVLPILRERMPAQHARLLAMRCTSIDAKEAHRIGLIDEIAADAKALQKQLRAFKRLIARLHPEAIADLKRKPFSSSLESLEASLFQAAAYTAHCLSLTDRVEGIRAFLQGEATPWASAQEQVHPASQDARRREEKG
jgi:enoyl-CoA hydratase/carnithine racemase